MHATMGRGERGLYVRGRRACPLVRQAVAVGLLTRADAERAALLARATRPCATCVRGGIGFGVRYVLDRQTLFMVVSMRTIIRVISMRDLCIMCLT